MALTLIDARCLADANGGGVARVARLWIERSTYNTKQITYSKDPSIGHPESGSDTEQITNTLSDSSNKPKRVQPDKIASKNEIACVTTGMRPSQSVEKFCRENDFKYLHLRIPNKLWTLGCLTGILSLTRSAERRVGKIDRVLLPNLAFAGRMTRPYGLLLHDLSFLIEPHWFGWRRRWWHRLLPVKSLISGADKIHCVSEQTRRDTIRLTGIPTERTAVFRFDPKLPSVVAVRPAWLPDNLGRYALMLGGNDPRKNVCTAISAITNFNLEHKDSPLVPIVIGGPVRKAHNPNLLSCMYAPGKVSDQELAFLYGHASVFLYPSWYEGFGLPLHEAHQYGTPCISSTAGALPETAPLGTVFCNPAKPHEWLAAITAIAGK